MHNEELKNSTTYAYSGQHIFCFWLNCPPIMIIRDHTHIQATRVEPSLKNFCKKISIIASGNPPQNLNITRDAADTQVVQ